MTKVKSANTAAKTSAHDPTMPRASAPLVFDGTTIRDRDQSLSLTDMWKAHGSDPSKAPSQWLRTDAAKAFVEFVAENLKRADVHVCQTTRGVGGGTWAHWHIAFAYAKYLSPAFHVWCNEVARAVMEGRMAPVGPGLAKTSAVSPDALETILAKLTTLEEGRRADAIKMESLESTVSKLNHQLGAFRYSDNGLVGASRARTYIRNPLNTLAGKLADIKKQSKRRILNELENSVREACGHPKFTRGNTWDHLPMSDLGDALRAISHLEAKHHPEIDAHERKMIGERQLKLVK